MDGQREYITDLEHPEVTIDLPLDDPYNIAYLAHTPSYNNSPFSGHSDLSFANDLGFFDDDPARPGSSGIINDYDPTDYDNPNSSLLMFTDHDYMRAYEPTPIIDAHRAAPYDYSSPSSNGGGDSPGDRNDRRSRASSTSSNLAGATTATTGPHHFSPSPRLDVAHSFEHMTFHSPVWGTEPLPSSTSPPAHKAPSPPRLVMPDPGNTTNSSGYSQPPTINAPDGDGDGIMGPSLHIVPATPIGDTGANAARDGSIDHHGIQRGPNPWDNALQTYPFTPDTNGASNANATQPSRSAHTPFLFPQPQRSRSKSDTSLELPNWDTPFMMQQQQVQGGHRRSNSGSALDDVPSSFSLHQQPQQQQHQPFGNGFTFGGGASSSTAAPPSPPTLPSNGFLVPDMSHHVQQQQQQHQLGHGHAHSLSQQIHSTGGGLHRSKSDSANPMMMRPGHRLSRSEDIRGGGAGLLYPPTQHDDFVRHHQQQQQFLSPTLLPSTTRSHHQTHYRRGSSGSRSERGTSASSAAHEGWGNAGLGIDGSDRGRPSPYPSPNVSPRGRYGELPPGGGGVGGRYSAPMGTGYAAENEGTYGGLGPGAGSEPLVAVSKRNVTTGRTANASHKRRKQEATFVCPVPGCGSTFTRSFNLKGHIRSHNEEKPFQCHWPGCGKGFARQHDCKRHEQLHTNYRPFNCDGCGKQFARMDALNRHLRSEGGAECLRMQEANGTLPAGFAASGPAAALAASVSGSASASSLSGPTSAATSPSPDGGDQVRDGGGISKMKMEGGDMWGVLL